MALVFSLLVLVVIVAFASACTGAPSGPTPSTPVAAPATPSATHTLPASPSSSPVPVRRVTPLPTSTRSPLFRTPLPGATASPAAGETRCDETTGRIVDDQYFSRVSNTEQHYLAYLPPCAELSNRRYPTIYLLHGSQNDDTHWERLGVFQEVEQGLAEGRLAPAIIILPEADPNLFINTSGGAQSFEGVMVDEVVPIVDRSFPTDPRPQMRAIGGISRGGVWSLEIGFRHPELFSIVAGHSPSLNVNTAPPQYDPLLLTDTPSLKTQRIWIDAGDGDYCRPGAEALHLALDNSGVAHEYHVWPGLHDDPLWAEHLTDYLEFYARDWPRLTNSSP